MSDAPVLAFRGVVKRFGSREALRGVDLEVRRGEIFGLLGPDGAGKTTLLRVGLGLLEAEEGETVLLGGATRGRDRVGYVPQRFSLYRDLSVRENLCLFGALYGTEREIVEEKGKEILIKTDLWPFRDRLADRLSGGMKQKLALAAGLMHRPELLVLDEPTTGVDPVSRREFWELLYALHEEGLTVLVCTPYMDEAELCTRLGFLHQGALLRAGTGEELLSGYPWRILEVEMGGRDGEVLRVPGVREVNAFGERYHLVTGDPEEVRRRLEASENGKIRGVREIPPTLEDLFVHLAEEAS